MQLQGENKIKNTAKTSENLLAFLGVGREQTQMKNWSFSLQGSYLRHLNFVKWDLMI